MILIRKLLMQCVLFVAHVVLWVALALPTVAQIPGLGNANTPPPAQQAQDKDPFGRSTPRGTITGFIRAVHSDNFVSAARYMQLLAQQRPNTETLARDLNELMDRYFQLPVSTISGSPEGELNDGLPLDREKLGPLKIGGREFYIGLVRIKDREAGEIWLISSDTLSLVPSLHSAIEKTWVERVMPEALSKYTVFGISFAQVLAWAASIAIPLLLLSLASLLAIFLARKIIGDPTRRRLVDAWHAGLRWPSIVVLTLVIHLASLSALGISLMARLIYARIAVAVLIVASAWFLNRLLTLSFAYTCSKMQRREYAATRSLMLLGERVLKVLIILVAAFLMLMLIGVESITALGALGIVGVALALGAQKTVENFLGGVFLLTDKALAVGDVCSISNRVGVVEDITLRSIRLRTLEQTLLSIPAGVLSQDSIENFTTRGKILAQTTLRLRYGTSTERLRSLLDKISRLLAENPQIENGTSRVRLVNFGVHAIEIELFAYFLTADFLEFLAVREELLLQIAGIVDAAGSGFARPEIWEVKHEPTPAQKKQRVL